VVLEEFNLTELNNSISQIQRSGSGWLQWAAFASQADWESCLFDSSENITSIGTAFKNTADSVKSYSSSRPLDNLLIDMNLKNVLISRMAQDTVYREYVSAVYGRKSPAGFKLINYQSPYFLKLIAPAVNEKRKVGESLQVQWDIINWNILYKTTVDISLSRDNGKSWDTIASNINNNGSYNWIITEPASDSCIMAIVDHNDSTIFSKRNFSITTATSIESSNNKTPSKYLLEQNYPNPFNPTTKIKYSIPAGGTSLMKFVQLKVYDILGREVSTLVNEAKTPGNYKVIFNARNLPSGVYFYRIAIHSDQLKASTFNQTKKMLLLR
jgi:hypothetical protein